MSGKRTRQDDDESRKKQKGEDGQSIEKDADDIAARKERLRRSLAEKRAKAKAARQQQDEEDEKAALRAKMAGNNDRRAAVGSSKEKVKTSSNGPDQAKKPSNEPSSKGLSVPLHPMLQQLQSGGSSTPRTSSLSASPAATPGHSTPLPVDLNYSSQNKYLEDVDKRKRRVNPYVDPAATASDSWEARRRKGLRFNKPGKFEEIGEEARKEAEAELQKRKAEEEYRQKLTNQGMDLIADELAFKPSQPPKVEWWDEEIINDPGAITDLIQNPVIIRPAWEKHQPTQLTMHMTKKEMKRKRKLRRAEIHKEEQDRVRLGLDAPPEPKLRLQNMAQVLTNEAIKDPTALEMKVRKQIDARREKHEQENNDRKLTKDEKWAKEAEKIERDMDRGIVSAVLRIETLKDPSHKFIVNAEARKYLFTGIVIFGPTFALIVVEGGALQVKKYIKRLGRIQWTVKSTPKDEETARIYDTLDLSNNKCSLVWQGQLKAPKFQKWTLKDAETEQDAKELLRRNNAESYWLEARSSGGGT